MALLDLFNFNKKNTLKTIKGKGTRPQRNENLAKLTNVREQNTNEMFNNIANYTATRNSLIQKSLLNKNDISDEEASLIINDFFENIVEQLPQGIIVPIKTTFVYKGKEQILLIGKNIITVGKFLKANASVPRHSMKGRELVAFFIDNNEEFDLFDQTKNTRIQLSPDTRPKIINLVNEDIIDCKTMQFRISNIEISFTEWERSLESITKPLEDRDLMDQIIDYLVSLDFEVTTGISKYFSDANEKLKEINKQHNVHNTSTKSDIHNQSEVVETPIEN